MFIKIKSFGRETMLAVSKIAYIQDATSKDDPAGCLICVDGAANLIPCTEQYVEICSRLDTIISESKTERWRIKVR